MRKYITLLGIVAIAVLIGACNLNTNGGVPTDIPVETLAPTRPVEPIATSTPTPSPEPLRLRG